MHPNIWYPFTTIKGANEPLKVKEGRGIWLTLEDGRKIVDCISSWWVNLHGHSHPDLTAAIAEQAGKLEHVIFSNFTHQPAETLAELLSDKLSGRLNRVFFSDDGSTSVEVALKIAWQYWKNCGQNRSRFIAFEGAYHGDTLGAMSAGARSLFSQVFNDLMFDVEFIPYPETWEDDNSVADKEATAIALLREKLESDRDRYAGIIVEPLVQGAGGMRMSREPFLKMLRNECRQSDPLLIFDEVMTGFGRTGEWFASGKAGVEPDIICLAKGLTGGTLPLAATVCSDHIYESFNNRDPLKTLWHGHSYTANPIGCAVAAASWKLLENNRMGYAGMESLHRSLMQDISERPYIERPRVCGTVAAFTIKTAGKQGYLNRVSDEIKRQSVHYDLLIRPLGNVIYLMPPYCITRDELAMVYKNLTRMLDDLLLVSK